MNTGVNFVEVQNLRDKVEQLESDKKQLLKYCNPEYFKELWVKGFIARNWCESQNGKCSHICDHVVLQTMNELWEKDRHQMFIDEMEELGLEETDEFIESLKNEW